MKLAELFKQSSIYMVGEFVRRCAGFLMIPVYTRYLSTSDYGLLELVELFVMVAGVYFGMLAISDGMVRIYHDYSQQKSRNAAISTAVVGTGVCGVLIFVVASLVSKSLSSAVFGTVAYVQLIQVSFLAFIFSSLTDIGLTYQRLRQRAGMYVAFSVTQLFVNIGLNIYFIAYLKKGVWGFVLAKLVVCTLGSTFLLVRLFREAGFHFEREVVVRIAKFSTPLVASGGAIFLIHFADRFFLSHYGTLSEVGIYALAYKFGFLVSYAVGTPFASAWGVRLYAHTTGDRWREQFARVLSYLAFALVLLALALSLSIDKLIGYVASREYAPAALLIPILAFAYVLREVGDFFRGILFINKRVAIYGRITVGCAVFNLILNWALIGQYKAAGAAWATLFTWLAYMAACWVLASREHQIPYSIKAFSGLVGLALVLCLAVSPMKSMPLPGQWIVTLILFAAFTATVWTSGYFSTEERVLIRRQLAMGKQRVLAWGGAAAKASYSEK